MSLRKIICIWALLSFPFSASADCPVDNIRVGLFDFPPLYYQSPPGQVEGRLVRLMDAVARDAGCTWSPRFFNDAPSLGKSLLQGEIELMMVIRHPLLETRALYGSVPLTELELNLYHAPQTPGVREPAGLRDKKLVVIRGYGYGGLIDQLLAPEFGIDIRVGADHSAAFDLLFEGDVDYVLGYQGPSSLVLADIPPDQIARTPLSTEALYFVVSKRVSDPEGLLFVLERSLERVR